MKLTANSIAALLLFLLTAKVRASDWPQILGLNRDGKAQQETLAESWPAAGPKVLWRHAVGSGYAGAAVVDDACVIFHRVGDEVIVERLDAATGQPKWKKSFPTHYVTTIAPDNGPRCTPIVQNNRVYLFGADGDLHALALADGNILWSRDLYQECKAPSGYFGAGSSPLVEGNLILVNVGGKDANGIVALDSNTGKTIWHKTDEQASYSSPVATTIGNARHAIFVTRLNVVSLDPLTGAEYFRFPFGQRGPTVNAANPVVVFESESSPRGEGRMRGPVVESGAQLFVTASYGVGARLAKLSATGDAKTLWENDDTLSSQYTTPIELGGFLYGIDGRQDAGIAELRCVELATGKIRWNEPGFGTGNLIAVSNTKTLSPGGRGQGEGESSSKNPATAALAETKLLIQKTSGELLLVRASPEKFLPLATAKIFPDGSTIQALPALSAGRYFVRDEHELVVLQVGK